MERCAVCRELVDDLRQFRPESCQKPYWRIAAAAAALLCLIGGAWLLRRVEPLASVRDASGIISLATLSCIPAASSEHSRPVRLALFGQSSSAPCRVVRSFGSLSAPWWSLGPVAN